MRRAFTYASTLAIAAGMSGLAAPAMAAEEIETPLEEKLLEQGVDIPAETTQQSDRLVATVGGTEIRESDIRSTIEGLPAGVQQTPPQMLLPAVVDQLIMRELIVEEARAQNLQENSEVKQLTDASSETAMEQALVEVWLQRELGERVTDAQVEQAVGELKAQNPDMQETPGLVSQVTQALQVQAMTDISDELRSDAEIVFYGPTGEPVEQQVGSGTEGESGATDTETGSTETQN